MSQTGHIPRILVDATLAENATVTLPDDKRHHLATVLRLTTGSPLVLFNGDGGEYSAILTQVDRKRAEAMVQQRHEPARESPLSITLFQAVARGDRMDFALAKAVELGVSAIWPVFTQRGKVQLAGNRLIKKQHHWRRVMDSAAEQSGRLIRPTLFDACSLQGIPAHLPDTELRLLLVPEGGSHLGSLPPARHMALFIGPESGFSTAETAHMTATGWQPVALGPRTLRTETAGMAALAALQTLQGDLR